MSNGSQQLRQFRRAIRDGATLDEACAATGGIIGPEEGRLHIAADLKNPPPPEAFELLYDPEARAAASTVKETSMATQPEDGETVELKAMDFKKAVKLYRSDIRPEKTEAASHQQAVGEAYKAIKKDCHIQPQSAKSAIKAFEMEDAHRDDYLRGFCGLLNELAGFTLVTFHGEDLVDIAEGKTERPRPQLVTVDSDGTETDLADAGEGDEAEDAGENGEEFTEASDEELAAQEGRGKKASVSSVKSAPAPGETVQ